MCSPPRGTPDRAFTSTAAARGPRRMTATLVFVEKEDQRVWMLTERRPAPAHPRGSRDAVRRAHVAGGAAARHPRGAPRLRSPHRDIVEVPLDRTAAWNPSAILSLTEDSDFLAQPVLSSDGSHLAWIAWDHPNMPWDTTELRVGRIEDGLVAEWATIAGGDGTAPLQPVWTGEDDLVYSDDPTGRWNLWRLRLTADLDHGPIAPADADTGGALWGLGMRWFAVLDDGRIVAVRTNGEDEVVLIDADGSCDGAGNRRDRERRHRRRPRHAGAAERAGRARLGRAVVHRCGRAGRRGARRGRILAMGSRMDAAGPCRHLCGTARRGPRVRLCADEPRSRGSRGRAAAVRRVRPRRPDGARRGRRIREDRVLHQSRHRRARRQLRRLDRLRPRIPRAAAGSVGRRRRG